MAVVFISVAFKESVFGKNYIDTPNTIIPFYVNHSFNPYKQ